MYQQKTVIGGFTNGNYWSSFEYLASDAWDINFNSGYQSEDSKDNAFYVRAIRAFWLTIHLFDHLTLWDFI